MADFDYLAGLVDRTRSLHAATGVDVSSIDTLTTPKEWFTRVTDPYGGPLDGLLLTHTSEWACLYHHGYLVDSIAATYGLLEVDDV